MRTARRCPLGCLPEVRGRSEFRVMAFFAMDPKLRRVARPVNAAIGHATTRRRSHEPQEPSRHARRTQSARALQVKTARHIVCFGLERSRDVEWSRDTNEATKARDASTPRDPLARSTPGEAEALAADRRSVLRGSDRRGARDASRAAVGTTCPTVTSSGARCPRRVARGARVRASSL